jgi:hypothetical protein
VNLVVWARGPHSLLYGTVRRGPTNLVGLDAPDQSVVKGSELAVGLIRLRSILTRFSLVWRATGSPRWSSVSVIGPIHLAYNPSYSACFFQPEQYFSLTKNQPTVFFSRLIIPAERGHCLLIGWSFAGGASAEVITPACTPLSSLHCHHPKTKRGRNDHSSNTPCYVLWRWSLMSIWMVYENKAFVQHVKWRLRTWFSLYFYSVIILSATLLILTRDTQLIFFYTELY